MNEHPVARPWWMSSQLESELLKMLNEGLGKEALKRLAESPGVPRLNAKQWITDHLQGNGINCPYCGEKLPSARAKQCFACGMDWHNPTGIERKEGDWNRWSLDKTSVYVVQLRREPNGRRHIRYREISSEPDLDSVFETEPRLGSDLIALSPYRYADYVKLSNGEWFGFDSQGRWMTQKEIKEEKGDENEWH